MNRYITFMIIPEKEKGVKTIRIPSIVAKGLLFVIAATFVFMGIIIYDYSQVLSQVYQNKHLSLENKQLKDQIQMFQTRVLNMANDVERIRILEKKLRMITGLSNDSLIKSLKPGDNESPNTPINETFKTNREKEILEIQQFDKLKNYQNEPEYKKLKRLYEQKVSSYFGVDTNSAFSKEWTFLNSESSGLSTKYAQIDFSINTLKNLIYDLEVDINGLDSKLIDRTSFLKSLPSLRPAVGPLTSFYGPRVNPVSGYLKMHEGLDIAGAPGSAIYSPADGIISFAGYKPGFGLFVQIDHGYGIETIFGHASQLIARKGQNIKRGELIAKIGNTGSSTGPHLHYEVRVKGTPVDPMYYVLN